MALTGQKLEEKRFENEVNKVARQLYPNTEGDGAILFQGKERDGVFINEDSAVAIESTVSKGSGKARDDGRKLAEICEYLSERYPDHDVRGYFITKHEPTGDQRSAIKAISGGLISALSFDAFRDRLLKVSAYLSARESAPFGSARNPLDGSLIELGEYMPMDFVQLNGERKLFAYRKLVDAVRTRNRVVLLGDYGAGKSMTLRQVFLGLMTEYIAGATTSFPIHLNLRQHHGQDEPAEALARHARLVGFVNQSHLVRAWRAGYAHIILDGFDEIAPSNLGGGISENELNARRSSVELIRKFIEETPIDAGILIAGRRNFFYGFSDLLRAMDLQDSTIVLSASDFTDEQVEDYLATRGWTAQIPNWLPTRPLLLGYLAAQSVLGEIVAAEDVDASEGWDFLLDLIFDREAKIENGLTGPQLRQIFERLATRARRAGSGLGPLYFEDCRQAFRDVVGHMPDTKHEVALRRLPMLSPDDAKKESKRIIDKTLADVARSGDIVRYVNDPYSFELESDDWLQLLEEVGIGSAAHRLEQIEHGRELTTEALTSLARGKGNASPLAADLLSIAVALGCEVKIPFTIKNLTVGSLELAAESNLSRIEFVECLFGHLEIRCPPEQTPTFYDCVFVEVDGAANEDDLAKGRFVNCEFEQFLPIDKTSAVLLGLPVSIPVRVALVILKRLYIQVGSGRKDGALRRGMSPDHFRFVNDVIDILISEDLMTKSSRRGSTTIWVPIKAQRTRVQRILDGANSLTWGDDEQLISKLDAIRQ